MYIDVCFDIYVMMRSYLSETCSSARTSGHCFWLVRDTWPLWAVTQATQMADFVFQWLELF